MLPGPKLINWFSKKVMYAVTYGAQKAGFGCTLTLHSHSHRIRNSKIDFAPMVAGKVERKVAKGSKQEMEHVGGLWEAVKI